MAERAAYVDANHEGRGGWGRILGRAARPEGERQPNDDCERPAHQRAPSATLPANGVLASTSSIERNGRAKCGRPTKITKPKLKPAAISWRIGNNSSSQPSRTCLWNHSRSALSALIGPCQKSRSGGAPPGAPAPCACANACRPRRPISPGAPKRPNKNHVIPPTPTQPKNASPIVPNTPSC